MPQPHLSGSAALALLIGPGTEFNWERGQGGRDDIEHTEKHDVVQLLHRQGEHPRGAEGEALETYSEEILPIDKFSLCINQDKKPSFILKCSVLCML